MQIGSGIATVVELQPFLLGALVKLRRHKFARPDALT
jgi:hypothetical protein